MNVGIVSTWFERGAAYVSRQYLKAISSDEQNNVYIYARGGEAYANNQSEWDLQFVTWGKKTKKHYNGATGIDKKDFLHWLKKNQIDTVLFNEQNWWIPVLWCKELGVKTGTYVDYYTEETVPFFGIYDYIFCNTLRHYNLFKHIPQCYFVPWGTDVDLFKPSAKINKKQITFFHSAGMNPTRKGTDIVINAFLSLPSGNNSKLLIHTQVPLESSLSNLDKAAFVNPSIEIRTETVPAPGLYSLGDVYVYPSILDGLGLTVVEALACGLPCIVPNNAPMNEFVEEDVNGKIASVEYLYSRSDGYFWPQCKISVDSVMKQMLYYIDHVAEIDSIKKNVRQLAVEKFNWQDRYYLICKCLKDSVIKAYDYELAQIIEKYEYRKNGKYNIIPYLFYYWKLFKK